MHKNGERSKQYHSSPSSANERLKQKKRLSFREPEVEAPHNSSCSNSNRIQSKPSALLALKIDGPKQSSSLEDLTLEDQTFIIAKHVGQAFDKRPCERRRLNTTTTSQTSCLDSIQIRRNGGFLSETLQNDCSHIASGLQKNESNSRVAFSSEDAQYFEALSPPILNMSTMKFPAIEVNESSVVKPNQVLVASTDMVSTSVQHQMQFLKYQLEQQRQQTQAALAHIQLLKDQLQAETSARFKAQMQNHQLIMQNKELLDHIQKLFQQIQELEKLTEKLGRKPTFPSSSSSHESQEIRIAETTSTNSITAQKNNDGVQSTKVSAFAPNSVMATRRSSLTGSKPFQPRTNYLEPNSKRSEVRINSRGSSPSPASQMRSPDSAPDSAKTNNSHVERSYLFNTQRYDGIKGDSTKELHDGNEDSSTKERQSTTKTDGDFQVSSISKSNLAAKNTTKNNPKSLTNNELNLRDENLVLTENPFLIEEKNSRKLEGYTSRKNHSSDPSPEYGGSKVSSVSLSPKSYIGYSKSSKLRNNTDSVLPLTLDNTANLYITENSRFTSGTSKLFNS